MRLHCRVSPTCCNRFKIFDLLVHSTFRFIQTPMWQTHQKGLTSPLTALFLHTAVRIHNVVAECAYTQDIFQLHGKLKGLLEALPEIIMVIIIEIQGPAYRSPIQLDEAWCHFNSMHKMLDQTKFIREARDQGHRIFTNPIVVGKHTWCSVTGMKYEVWLKAQTGGAIDLAEKDNYAEGHFPDKMVDFELKTNEGFNLIKKRLIDLYPNRDLDLLRNTSIHFPSAGSDSSGELEDDLLHAMQRTAFAFLTGIGRLSKERRGPAIQI
ncbi:hypothetical protein M378DRAFT_408982 [Amanita muscaria Koide BX008]|uniref:Uncharacterized protein n=1 Tax=Amanita muscaria (strain Koide BX008) TaxID=946122 RepID=A0A0C2XBN0_AMAMK|nr:hypothetical protein M378DRAFT_408982 [Amanita muscaria Koide BX008]